MRTSTAHTAPTVQLGSVRSISARRSSLWNSSVLQQAAQPRRQSRCAAASSRLQVQAVRQSMSSNDASECFASFHVFPGHSTACRRGHTTDPTRSPLLPVQGAHCVPGKSIVTASNCTSSTHAINRACRWYRQSPNCCLQSCSTCSMTSQTSPSTCTSTPRVSRYDKTSCVYDQVHTPS